MTHKQRTRLFIGAVSLMIACILAGPAAQPALAQDDQTPPAPDQPAPTAPAPAPAAPVAADIPGLLGCGASPYFALSGPVAFIGAPVAWWAAGLQQSSQAGLIVIDRQANLIMSRSFGTADRQCQSAGTITLPGAALYEIQITGTSATTGQTVVMSQWIRGVTPQPTPVAAPTPVTAPPAPANVRVTVLNPTTARVDWDAPVTNQANFLITSRAGQLSQPAQSRTVTVGGLVPGALYCFSVYGVSDSGTALGGIDCTIQPVGTPPSGF